MNRRLQPRPSQANYILLRALAAQLRREIAIHFGGRTDIAVVDVGCGDRPYEGLFAGHVARYVGVDVVAGPKADIVASGDALPFPDESFDCVLCSQVLEHVEDPAAVLAEFHRVLTPGGVALVSTHGNVRYHATLDRRPDDYWRWTHAGLHLQFTRSAAWTGVTIRPNGGTVATLAFVVGRELDVALGRVGGGAVAAGLHLVMNAAAWRADRAIMRAYPGRPPDLAPNYLAVARK